jgi:hypothetical protein
MTMAGPFIIASERETSRPLVINATAIACVAPHGRSGSFIFFAGGVERMEVEQTPDDVATLLREAGLTCRAQNDDA